MRGRRQLIHVGFNPSGITLYERAQTRGCWDLRDVGTNSSVKVITRTGQIHYEPPLNFESIPNEEKNLFRLKRDQRAVRE
jgi:hypothetical protein